MRYPTRATLFVTLSLPLAAVLAGWSAAPEQLALQADSRVWVDGTSSLKAFTCKATQVDAAVEASSTNSVAHIMSGEKAVKSVDLTVASAKMDCSNGTMNDHMREALKVNEFPTIAFHVASYDVAKGTDGVSGTLTGTLTLGGVTRPVTVSANATEVGGALHVLGSYELNMTEYSIKPPSLFFGRIKVRDNVTVRFDLLLKS